MPGPFHTKVVLVTGAASGIGRATALRFAREGASVVGARVEAVGAQETVRLIKAATGEAIFIGCDVSQAQKVKAMITQAVATSGRLDYDLNITGIEGELSATADYPGEVWNKVIGINLTDPYLCMKYALAQMLKQGGGASVNMASILGVVEFATAGTIHIARDEPDAVLTCMCPQANPEANRQENKHLAVGRRCGSSSAALNKTHAGRKEKPHGAETFPIFRFVVEVMSSLREARRVFEGEKRTWLTIKPTRAWLWQRSRAPTMPSRR